MPRFRQAQGVTMMVWVGSWQMHADAAEEHHGGLPAETPVTSGTVTGITAVHYRYAPLPDATSRDAVPRAGLWHPHRGELGGPMDT